MFKKRFSKKIIMTLALFALAALKIIHWLCHPELDMIKPEVIQKYIKNQDVIVLMTYYGIYPAAVFSLVTIWLPSKAQPSFGTIAFLISSVMGLLEIGIYIALKIGCLVHSMSLFSYTGLDPLLTAGVLAVMVRATTSSDEYNGELKILFRRRK